MATFTDVAALIPTLCGQLVDGGDADCARASMMRMTDAEVVKVLEETSLSPGRRRWRGRRGRKRLSISWAKPRSGRLRSCGKRRCPRLAGCSSRTDACAWSRGESQEVELSFDVARLAVWDESLRLEGAVEDWLHEGALRVQPGTYALAAGPSVDDLPVSAELQVSAGHP